MNRFVLVAVLALVAITTAQRYSDRYDDINIDEILENRKLLVPYVKCVLDQGRCTPEGKELKVHIKDAMQHSCEKCTEKQKKGAKQVVKHIREKESEFWEQLKTKFDPGNKYQESYEKFLAADD